MSAQPISEKLFIRLLERRFLGKYDEGLIRLVLQAYTSEKTGLRAKLKSRNEFKDDYFGSYRFTEKGFKNLGLILEEGLKKKLNFIRFARELSIHKKQHEKRNNNIWKARNMVIGYKFKNEFVDSFRKKRNQYKNQQMLYLSGQQRKELKSNRKTKI
jgi:hypothetical protein